MMPPLTVWALRSAVVSLVVGFTIGALMLIDKGTGAIALDAGWLHSHMHLLLFGFFVQMIFAIAYWMLPTFGRDRPRGGLAVAAVALVNAASLGALAFPWLPVHQPLALFEIGAVLAFAGHAWPRVKAFGS